MMSYNLILGFLDNDGNFDVSANIRDSTPQSGGRHIMLFSTKEEVRTIINKLLQGGKMARDNEGDYYTLERQQP